MGISEHQTAAGFLTSTGITGDFWLLYHLWPEETSTDVTSDVSRYPCISVEYQHIFYTIL